MGTYFAKVQPRLCKKILDHKNIFFSQKVSQDNLGNKILSLLFQADITSRERTLMMSNFRGGGGGSKMTPKNRTLQGKNRTLWGPGMGDQESSKIVGHHLWMIPKFNVHLVSRPGFKFPLN